jgi:intracellular sulfur oxidation DsrE/DsrF family protein
MKKIFLLSTLAVLTSFIQAQNADYKVVFDMTSRDTVNNQTVVREANLIKETNPDANIEVVVYSQGLDLVLKDKSTQAAAVEQLINDKKVSFKVCAMTMKRNNIDESQLLPGVEIVPDGIYEIISKQREGWGYIKVAH